ncbi:baculoviral IAP repeat-containing protein 7-A-like [Amphibalanus amphitrite]|uniref:baculoviral IAP repeat-containing protein 7-A-like n=1 Tax=Amphibalanus amphitrite TaxID=1232801 RepID=UPI001C903298|nr:baculoviral IAP repeat-containing protein 7-A-like [Amphibalanus amphitrite]
MADMHDESNRRRTFFGWPMLRPSAEELARAGFFYTGSADVAQCAFCWVSLGNWDPSDDPFEEHRRHSPLCSFLHRLQTAPGSVGHHQAAGRDETGRHLHSPPPAVQPSPAPQEMTTVESRLGSFQGWPDGACVRPEVLARAGFYYTGRDDRVRCFHCGVTVGQWEPGDDPWSEHARHSAGCYFVKLYKPAEGGSSGEKVAGAGTSPGDRQGGRPILGRGARDTQGTEREPSVTGREDFESPELAYREPTPAHEVTSLGQESSSPPRPSDEPRLPRGHPAHDQEAGLVQQSAEVALSPEIGPGEALSSLELQQIRNILELNQDPDPTPGMTGATEHHSQTHELEESNSHPGPTQERSNREPEAMRRHVAEPTQHLHQAQDITGSRQSPNEVWAVAKLSQESAAMNGVPTTGAGSATAPGVTEYQRLRDERLCKICMEGDACVLFFPCNHMATCPACALLVRTCCICRSPIKDVMRVYMA